MTYEIECQGCENRYIVETARNSYTRGTEHAGGLENRDEKSALWKHCVYVEKLGKERQEFKISVTGVYGNDAIVKANSRERENQPSGERISRQHEEGMKLYKTS